MRQNHDAMATGLTPDQIRDAALPKARRGFEETATRALLAEAAAALSAVTAERDELKQQAADVGDAAAGADAEAIGNVLLTAKRMADELVATATEEAAAVIRDAEAERDEVVSRAKAEAASVVDEAETRIDDLRNKEEALRQSLADHRHTLVAFLQSALAQLEDVESLSAAVPEPAGLDGELLARVSPDPE
jgi:cell division septum initiation protein DivIVA